MQLERHLSIYKQGDQAFCVQVNLEGLGAKPI